MPANYSGLKTTFGNCHHISLHDEVVTEDLFFMEFKVFSLLQQGYSLGLQELLIVTDSIDDV